MLNFLIINKIEEIDFLVKHTKKKIFNLKTFAFLGEESRELYFQSEDLNQEFETNRNKFKNMYNQAIRIRAINREELDFLKYQIKKTREICESRNFRKKYINTTDIIEEDDRDNKDISDCSSIRKNSIHNNSNVIGVLSKYPSRLKKNNVLGNNKQQDNKSSFAKKNAPNMNGKNHIVDEEDNTKCLMRSNSFTPKQSKVHNEVIY